MGLAPVDRGNVLPAIFKKGLSQKVFAPEYKYKNKPLLAKIWADVNGFIFYGKWVQRILERVLVPGPPALQKALKRGYKFKVETVLLWRMALTWFENYLFQTI